MQIPLQFTTASDHWTERWLAPDSLDGDSKSCYVGLINRNVRHHVFISHILTFLSWIWNEKLLLTGGLLECFSVSSVGDVACEYWLLGDSTQASSKVYQ